MIKIKRLLEIKMKNKLLLLLIFFIFGLISCSNDDTASYDSKNSDYLDLKCIKYVSITDANSLFFYGDELKSRAISTGSQKMRGRAALKTVSVHDDESSSGVSVKKEEISEVKYFDDNKKVIDALNSESAYVFYNKRGYSFKLCDIFKINEIYTMFSYGEDEYVFFSFLVRNFDGKVFVMNPDNTPNITLGLGTSANYQYVKADGLRNIYYVSNIDTSQSKIIKAFVDEKDNLIESILIETNEVVKALEVDSYGNILYKLADSNGTYFFSRTGKLKYIGYTTVFWKGCDGSLYYTDGTRIKKILFEGNEVRETNYNDYDSGIWVRGGIKTFCLSLKNRILFVGNDNGGVRNNLSIFEVYNENHTCGKIELSNLEFSKINCAYATENYYFISGIDSNNKMVFVRVNPETDGYIKILPDDSYEIYSFVASESNGITFNGMDMNGGKIITAKVGINGRNVYPLDENSDEKIYGLTQISCETFSNNDDKEDDKQEEIKMEAPVISYNSSSGYLSWNSVSGATDYYIYYGTSEAPSSMKLRTTNGSYLTSIFFGGDYKGNYCCVRAYNSNGDIYSDYNNVVLIGKKSTEDDKQEEIKIEAPVISYSSSGYLSWNSVSGATVYYIYYGTSKDPSSMKLRTTNNLYLTSIFFGGDYKGNYCCVRAYNSDSDIYSDYSNVVLIDKDIKIEAPVISYNSSSGYLSWNSVSGATDYYIYYGTSEAPSSMKLRTTNGSYLTSIFFGGDYKGNYCCVRAYNSNGDIYSDYNNVVLIGKKSTEDDKQEEIKIEAPVISYGSSGYLSWNSVGGATDYYIYYGTSEDPSSMKLRTTKGSYLTSIFFGGDYRGNYCCVRAYNSDSDIYSDYSNVVLIGKK